MERPVLKSFCRFAPPSGIAAGALRLLPLAILLSACGAMPSPEDAGGAAAAGPTEPVGAASPAAPSRDAVQAPAAPPDEGPEGSLLGPYPGRIHAPDGSLPRYESLWERISAGLRLQQHYARPEVREQLRLYASRPDYFKQVGERARPFLHHIAQQIEQRGMPMEIALIPFVESGFNPQARSFRAATGPWQFMAGTARGLGLRIDEWFDGRRDPIQAAAAALDYLEIQQQRFEGNWLLAFAAYNSGPATVSQAVRSLAADPGEVDFWELPLPAETRVHVPRILALASILAGMGETEFALPDIADEKVLERVKVGASASLVLTAELAGLEPDLLRGLNPGFRQWWTPPTGGPDFLHLPASNAEALRLALQQTPGAVQADAIRYRIQPGDTLSGIAGARSISVDLLRSRNGLDNDLIVAGEYLWIPGLDSGTVNPRDAMAPDESAARSRGYIVQPGDSLWTIARRHGLEVDALASLNQISPSAVIFPGQELTLAAAAGAGTEIYRIRRGDTLSRIAARFGRTLDDILLWNSIEAEEPIFPGQILRIAPPSEGW